MNGWLTGAAAAPAAAPRMTRLPMVLDAGSRLLVSRRDWRDVRLAPDPDAPAARALAAGEVRLAIERFLLTAEDTAGLAPYASDDAAWVCLAVRGVATVAESRAPGLPAGTRVAAWVPMGTHAVIHPGGPADALRPGPAPRNADAWHAFVHAVQAAAPPWLVIRHRSGSAVLEAEWRRALAD